MRDREWEALAEADPFGERARPWCQDGCDMPVAECVHSIPDRSGEAVDRAELAKLMLEAGPDEVRVLLYVARRLVGLGQRQYGLLSIATDKRDMRAEAAAEFGDSVVYLAIDGLRRCLR